MFERKESAATSEILVGELRASPGTGKLGVLLLLVAVSYAAITFREKADATALSLWTGGFALILSLWLGTLFWLDRRPPVPAAITRFWLPFVKALAVVANLLVAASVWIFLPVAEPELRGLMTILYIWYIVVQIMAETDASSVSRSAILLVMGSLVLHEFANAQPMSLALGGFLILFGASMLAFRRMIRRATVDAIRARLDAERAGAALRVALDDVAAQRDAIRRFLASASHDLQQPVQAASLFFDQAVASGEGATRGRAIQGARRAFASAQDLLTEMLDHLQAESGVAAPQACAIPLAPLLAELSIELEAQARLAGIAIRVAPTRYVVNGDPALLRRVLRNLMLNAILHSRGTRLLVGVRASADSARLHVVDNGSGVEVARQPDLFEAFGASRRAGGYGLGLATARRLLRAMGGDLALDGRWRNGACFVATLSRTSAPAPSPSDAEVETCKAA